MNITDVQQNSLFSTRNQSMTVLRNFYKSEDIFLDLFEDEYVKFLINYLLIIKFVYI